MLNQLRMLLAETLLSWAALIAPGNDEGLLLIAFLRDYCKAANEREKVRTG